MPGGDRTGPMGRGPLTGRGLGFCGRGLAFGRGFGRRFWTRSELPTREEEKRILEEDLKELELEKEEIKKRLREMK